MIFGSREVSARRYPRHDMCSAGFNGPVCVSCHVPMRLTNYISAVCRDILEGCVLKLSGLFSSSPVYVASYLTINSCVYKEVGVTSHITNFVVR